jgi:LacI family transcriptional regulator
MKKNITVRDIASSCNVSASTVSRVLSGSSYPVRHVVQEEVIRTARNLGYSFKTKKTGFHEEIAVVVPTTTNPFYTSLINGIERIVVKEGYDVSIHNFLSGSSKGNGDLLKNLIARKVRGVVIAAFDSSILEMEAVEMRNNGIKIVMVDSPKPDFRFNCISYDYEKGSFMGTEYLINKGHRHILYAGLGINRENRRMRINGFLNAIKEHQLPVSDKNLLIRDDEYGEMNQINWGEKICEQILALSPPPTAVVAVNDLVAFGLILGLHKSAVAVPEDISILGFDDNPFSELIYPALTTIQVQSEQMGYMAANLLIQSISGISDTPVNLYLKPRLIERSTVAVIN